MVVVGTVELDSMLEAISVEFCVILLLTKSVIFSLPEIVDVIDSVTVNWVAE